MKSVMDGIPAVSLTITAAKKKFHRNLSDKESKIGIHEALKSLHSLLPDSY